MADEPKPRRGERFTMLEPMGPNNPSPEELATRVVDIAFKERFTMLEPMGPNNPSPEELATRVVEPLINDGPVFDPPPAAVPPAVDNLLTQLAAAIQPLDAPARAKTLKYISTELARRLAS
jgi:hypothetical protein